MSMTATTSSFLSEYRDFIVLKNSILTFITETSSASDLYVALEETKEITTELLQAYRKYNLDVSDILIDIADIFTKLDEKLNKLEQLAYTFQFINTSEINSDKIYSFNSFDIVSDKYYNSLINSLTLPQKSNIRDIRPNIVKRVNNETVLEEYYIVPDVDNQYMKIGVSDISKITAISFYNSQDNLISSTTSIDSDTILLPDNVYKIFITVNDIFVNNYTNFTTITFIKFTFSDYLTTSFNTLNFKYSNTLKLKYNYKIPTNTAITVILDFIFYNINDQIIDKAKVKIGINNDGMFIDRFNKQDDMFKEVYELNNKLVEDNSKLEETDIVTIKNYSDNDNVKLYNENLIGLNIKFCEKFSIRVNSSMYSSNTTLSPELKNIMAYTTDDIIG